MYKKDDNNHNKTNNRRGFNASNTSTIAAQEPAQSRSYLASLSQPPADEVEAEAERAKLFGRQPRNTGTSGSFTK